MKRIRIDISPMVYTLHREWDGETSKTFNNYVKRKENKNRMINKITSIINDNRFYKLEININDRYAIAYFNEIETSNSDLFIISDRLTKEDLISYRI